DSLAISARRFAEGIAAAHHGLIEAAYHAPDAGPFEAAAGEVLAHMPLYADSAGLDRLAGMDSLAVDHVVASVRNTLASPVDHLDLGRRLRDPLGLCAPVIDGLMARAETSGIIVVDGQLFTRDTAMAIVLLLPTREGLE